MADTFRATWMVVIQQLVGMCVPEDDQLVHVLEGRDGNPCLPILDQGNIGVCFPRNDQHLHVLEARRDTPLPPILAVVLPTEHVLKFVDLGRLYG